MQTLRHEEETEKNFDHFHSFVILFFVQKKYLALIAELNVADISY